MVCFEYLKPTIFICLIILLFACKVASNCPNKCRCFKLDQNNPESDIIRLDCSVTKLFHIPLDIPSTVQILDLRQNFIEKFEEDKLAKLKNLHTILLSKNRIKHLNEVIIIICLIYC